MPPPTFLLAFANDWATPNRHLRSLLDESKSIQAALAPLIDAGTLRPPHTIHNATVDDIVDAFRRGHLRGAIRIFHFGGHAGATKLLLEDHAGTPAEAHATGLAGILGHQRGLVLVFLNGCSTEPQVERLRAAGVKAVVATTHAIADEAAAVFAHAFYAELTTRPLREAFDAAVHEVKLRWGDHPSSVTRELVLSSKPDDQSLPWPWILDCDPAYEHWSLAADYDPRRARLRRTSLAIGTVALLLAGTLTLSTEARRAACTIPLVRPSCASLGLGNVPTTTEQALWDQALAETSEDGLLEYLRGYPTGVYAEEAHSRLASCRSVREDSWGAERDIRRPLPVNPDRLHPFSTEDEARRDAIARGNRDAAALCEPPTPSTKLLSARTESTEWKCQPFDSGFVCGFEVDLPQFGGHQP